MERRAFIRLAGGGLVLAATAPLLGCSSALPDAALAAWLPPAADGDVRRWLLAHAILAPHSHNLQSWIVDLAEPDTLTLWLDPTRLLPETDPFHRQMLMSQGTFLELLDQAARQRGLRAEIALFPEGPFDPARVDARPTARIRLVADAALRPDPLFEQVFSRHTNREAYAPRPPAPEAVQAIATASALPGIRVGFTRADDPDLPQHRQIASAAWRIEMETPRTILESYRWLRIGPTEIATHRDGISINDPLLRAIDTLGLFDRTVAPAPGDRAIRGQIEDFDAKIATTPAFFWLVTDDNERTTQIAAGRAYVRAQLAATAHGLSMHPLQQALQEYPEQRAQHRAIHTLLDAARPGQTVQMWARLGYGPAIGPAPRRGVAAHLRRT